MSRCTRQVKMLACGSQNRSRIWHVRHSPLPNTSRSTWHSTRVNGATSWRGSATSGRRPRSSIIPIFLLKSGSCTRAAMPSCKAPHYDPLLACPDLYSSGSNLDYWREARPGKHVSPHVSHGRLHTRSLEQNTQTFVDATDPVQPTVCTWF